MPLAKGSSRLRQPLSQRRGSRLQQSELGKIPAVQGQVNDFAAGGYLSQRVADHFNQRGIRGDLNDLLAGSQLQINRQPQNIVHIQSQRLANITGKVRNFDGQPVLPNRQKNEVETSCVVRFGRFLSTGSQVSQSHGRILNHSTLRVSQSSFNSSRSILGQTQT